MKNLYLFTVLLIIGASVFCTSCIIGNGDLLVSETTVSPFKKIDIKGSAEVRFYESQEYRTVVTVDSNLFEYIEILTKGDTLSIGTKKGKNPLFTTYLVDVFCPLINEVLVSGSGRFVGMDNINVSTFTSDISGSGEIEGTIECEKISVEISGSGKIKIAGKSDNLNIEISGAGAFAGNEFDTKKATVRISGSGETYINVSENLNVNISGSGKVNYRGDPVVNSKISGSGRIRKM